MSFAGGLPGMILDILFLPVIFLTLFVMTITLCYTLAAVLQYADMGGLSVYLNIFSGLAMAVWLSACDTPTPVTTPSLPTTTPAPTLTSTPTPALSPECIWVGFDGLSDRVLSVSPEGDVSTLNLPLNDGQQASDVVAADDGSMLSYLVWSADRQQHGIAAWDLFEPNAHLVIQPLSGYRIITMHLMTGAASLLYVEVQADQPLAEADWRLESVSPQGGQPTLLISREADADLLPPAILGIDVDGRLLLNAARKPGSEGVEQGIYGFTPADGHLDLVSPLEDGHIVDGELSPDGTRLIYMTSGGPSAADLSDPSIVVAARLLDLKTGQVVTLAAPGGEDITSLRWYPDGKLLLMDVTPPGPVEQRGQFWAVADSSQTIPWRQTSVNLERAALFSYAPYQRGVVYTLFPAAADTEWHLYILADIAADRPPQAVSLETIEDSTHVPLILRVP